MSRFSWFVLLGLTSITPAFADGPAPATLTQDALLARRQNHDSALVVVDVRTPEEFVTSHVPGAINIPHDQIGRRLAELPKDKDLVLYCRTGRRVAIAAGELTAKGYTRLQHLEGDMAAWLARGLPVDVPADAAACQAALAAGDASPRTCAVP